MKSFLKILSLAKAYRSSLLLNVFFNSLSILFGIFSFVMFLPFLEVLFSEGDFSQILEQGLPEKFVFKADVIQQFGFYYMAEYMQTHSKMEMLFLLCSIIAVMILLKNLFRYLAIYVMAGVRNGIVRDYRNKIYSKLLHLPIAYFSDERKGDIISRMTNDVKEIEWSVLRSIEAVYRDPITIIFTVIVLVFMSPQMTLFILLLIPVAAVITLIGKKLRKVSSESQQRIGDMISTVEETLTGIKIIKAFNAEKIKDDQFKSENESYTKQMTKLFRRTDLASPLSEFLGVSVIILALLYGGNLVFEGTMRGSSLITYIGLFYTLIAPSKSFTQAVYNAQRGLASVDRINKILDAEETIKDKPATTNLHSLTDKLSFNNVSFSYEDELVLKNISLNVPRGKSVALVGQSGSGKSTIASLVPRFYDVKEGAIEIDGIDIKDAKLSDLRSLIGLVTQDAILFNDTIYNNIAFGIDHATEERVVEAAKIANAHDFIMHLPKGYQTNIGDGGGKLSGGQKQRISIARAVLKNPEILVLDEATSALDTESERLVQDALNKLMDNRTSIIIAHRLSTIQHADEIIVMNKGEIKERGTHNELISLNGDYKKLIDMQSFD